MRARHGQSGRRQQVFGERDIARLRVALMGTISVNATSLRGDVQRALTNHDPLPSLVGISLMAGTDELVREYAAFVRRKKGVSV